MHKLQPLLNSPRAVATTTSHSSRQGIHPQTFHLVIRQRSQCFPQHFKTCESPSSQEVPLQRNYTCALAASLLLKRWMLWYLWTPLDVTWTTSSPCSRWHHPFGKHPSQTQLHSGLCSATRSRGTPRLSRPAGTCCHPGQSRCGWD